MAQDTPLKTALYDRHVAMDAEMVCDAGWLMPRRYRDVAEEVAEVRRRAGVFDLSHVGRIRIRGDEALELVERACTADVIRQEDDTARVTLLCDEAGRIIDQCLIVRLEDYWLLTTTPSRREAVLAHLQTLADGLSATVDDQTPKTAMICVAGPAAEGILSQVLPVPVADLPGGAAKVGSLLIARYVALRTTYLGQWALEVVLTKMMISQAWRFITDKAGANAIAPAGLAARETLRIEAGQPRYGHELDETIDPFTAGLGWAVDFEHDFLGRAALEELRGRPPARKRVGLVLQTAGAAAPQPATPVTSANGAPAGAVTSGVYSPSLDKTIAMAYIDTDFAQPGQQLLVAGDPPRPAQVVPLPFVS